MRNVLLNNPYLSFLGFSLCSVVECDSCTLELAKGIDCFLNRCTLWSWDCDLEDCTGSLLPIGNFASKNWNEKSVKKLFDQCPQFLFTQFAISHCFRSECYSNVAHIVRRPLVLPSVPSQFLLWSWEILFVPHSLRNSTNVGWNRFRRTEDHKVCFIDSLVLTV